MSEREKGDDDTRTGVRSPASSSSETAPRSDHDGSGSGRRGVGDGEAVIIVAAGANGEDKNCDCGCGAGEANRGVAPPDAIEPSSEFADLFDCLEGVRSSKRGGV